MMARRVSRHKVLAGLPPEWPEDLLPDIQNQVQTGSTKIAVLDDDPIRQCLDVLSGLIPSSHTNKDRDLSN